MLAASAFPPLDLEPVEPVPMRSGIGKRTTIQGHYKPGGNRVVGLRQFVVRVIDDTFALIEYPVSRQRTDEFSKLSAVGVREIGVEGPTQ